eukprot:9451091-Karenia_brevis.AAC.1
MHSPSGTPHELPQHRRLGNLTKEKKMAVGSQSGKRRQPELDEHSHTMDPQPFYNSQPSTTSWTPKETMAR